jgi:hypothetical protein
MGRLFEPLRQYFVARSYSSQSARVIEGLGSGEDSLGPLSTVVGKRQKPWVGHWSALSHQGIADLASARR